MAFMFRSCAGVVLRSLGMTKSKQCMEKAATYGLLYIKYAADMLRKMLLPMLLFKCGLNAVNYV